MTTEIKSASLFNNVRVTSRLQRSSFESEREFNNDRMRCGLNFLSWNSVPEKIREKSENIENLEGGVTINMCIATSHRWNSLVSYFHTMSLISITKSYFQQLFYVEHFQVYSIDRNSDIVLLFEKVLKSAAFEGFTFPCWTKQSLVKMVIIKCERRIQWASIMFASQRRNKE